MFGPFGPVGGPVARGLVAVTDPAPHPLSENAVALGAVRLAMAQAPDGRGRPRITPRAVEAYWRETPLPAPATDREQALVYAVIYQVHDDHHRNTAAPGGICDLVASGLAPLARRAGIPLSPLETLTARYAVGPARRAWHHSLTPMDALDAFAAVRADLNAEPECVSAALTLVPHLPDDLDAAVTELRARVGSPARRQPPRSRRGGT
ncbi:hypothetical protein AB0M38_28660 [Streptomyces sp. NPDC051742]|uniref:hypothetical protein n=1 Tax=unclassified Streptomyces TaxID=2593676 RepID=UPI00343C7DBF